MITVILNLLLVGRVSSTENHQDKVAKFDPQLAKELYYYTKIAVCQRDEIETWDCGYFCNSHPRMTQVKVFENNTHSALAYAGFNKETNEVIVAFRSTQNLENILNDIKFLKTKYPCKGCQVHRGFYATYLDLKDQILAYVISLKKQHKNSSVTVLGHSLGAAMATFSLIDLRHQSILVKTFFIYGSPRVGNEAFSNYFSKLISKTKRVARITHAQDIVPHLPPSQLDYVHLLPEYWFVSDDQYVECEKVYEDPNCSNSVWSTSINDHQSYFGIKFKCGDEEYNKLTQTTIFV